MEADQCQIDGQISCQCNVLVNKPEKLKFQLGIERARGDDDCHLHQSFNKNDSDDKSNNNSDSFALFRHTALP